MNEVADFLIEHGIDGVQGNYDDAVANDKEHCGCKYEDPLQAEMTALSFEWTKKHATQKTKEFLKRLPTERHFLAQGQKILLFHATPHKNNLYCYEDRPERFFLEMGGKTDANILIYGHTHIPYRKDFGGRIFINAGSVGKPKDGDPRTCVALLNVTSDTVNTEFLRINYNIEKAAAAIVEKGLPPYFADKLRQGR